ncbi:uncharacterized protein ACNS7B_018540 [Menidia menidia]
MEGPEAAESPDNEYMTMDADQWIDHDDTYENGDTLGLGVGQQGDSRAQEQGSGSKGRDGAKKRGRDATQTTTNAPQLPLPLPNRYLTIRRPELGLKRGTGKTKQSVLSFYATPGLLVLCVLLIAALIALSFAYYRIADKDMKVADKIDLLRKEKDQLNKEVETLRNVPRPIYRISSTEYPGCQTGKELFIVNDHVFEEHVRNGSFFLYYSSMHGGSCFNPYYWICTC